MMCFRRLICSTSAPTKFATAFDSECALHITRKLATFPVQLNFSQHFGNGLFATRRLRRGETVFCEMPLLSFHPLRPDKDKRVSLVAASAPDAGWLADFSLVAQAVAIAADHPHGTSFDSISIPLRCLGWSSFSPASPEFVDHKVVREQLFSAITSHFQLDQHCSWTRDACRVLYDKVKTNLFCGSNGAHDVFEAASMLNHSCEPNVMFNPHKPDEILAVRDIAQGEQLFISYMVMPEDLPDLYGFTCTCRVCKQSSRE